MTPIASVLRAFSARATSGGSLARVAAGMATAGCAGLVVVVPRAAVEPGLASVSPAAGVAAAPRALATARPSPLVGVEVATGVATGSTVAGLGRRTGKHAPRERAAPGRGVRAGMENLLPPRGTAAPPPQV